MSDLKIIKLKIIGLKASVLFIMLVPLFPLTAVAAVAFALAAIGEWAENRLDDMTQLRPIHWLLTNTTWRIENEIQRIQYEYVQRELERTDG